MHGDADGRRRCGYWSKKCDESSGIICGTRTGGRSGRTLGRTSPPKKRRVPPPMRSVSRASASPSTTTARALGMMWSGTSDWVRELSGRASLVLHAPRPLFPHRLPRASSHSAPCPRQHAPALRIPPTHHPQHVSSRSSPHVHQPAPTVRAQHAIPALKTRWI